MGIQTILAPRYSRLLQRKFSMKGPQSVPDLGSEILPVYEIGMPPIEDRYLEDDRAAIAFINLPAGAAGKRSQAQIYNPNGSGVLIVVECISWSSFTGAVNNTASRQLFIRTAASLLASSVNGVKTWRDFRLGAGQQGVGIPSAGVNGDNTNALVTGTLLGALPGIMPHIVSPEGICSFVMPMGANLMFDDGTDAEALNVTLFFRERPLEPSEI